MAGSRKWFVYSSDTGSDFAVQLDESNTEAVMGATGDYEAASAVQFAIPRNIKPRAVYYTNAERTRTLKVTVLTAAKYAAIANGSESQTIPDPIAGTGNLFAINLQGERIQRPFPDDTGLDDGDAT